MCFKALKKGDIIRASDYVATEESFRPVGNTVTAGQRWCKSTFYPMYRKTSEAEELAATDNQQAKCEMPSLEKVKVDMVCSGEISELGLTMNNNERIIKLVYDCIAQHFAR